MARSLSIIRLLIDEQTNVNKEQLKLLCQKISIEERLRGLCEVFSENGGHLGQKACGPNPLSQYGHGWPI